MTSLRVLFSLAFISSLSFADNHPTIVGCPMFPPNNVWNTPIDSLPLDVHSQDYINSIGGGNALRYDIALGTTIVPGTQPLVPITVNEGLAESDPGPYPFPPNAFVEIGSDQHVLVIDKDHCVLYETFFSFLQPDNSWSVYSAAKWSLLSNALRPATWTSGDAAGLPITPGLIFYDEANSGHIDHALRFTAPRTQR